MTFELKSAVCTLYHPYIFEGTILLKTSGIADELVSKYGCFVLSKIIYGGRTKVIFRIFSDDSQKLLDIKHQLERNREPDKVLQILENAVKENKNTKKNL